MNESKATLVLHAGPPSSRGLLAKYMELSRKRAFRRLPGPEAETAHAAFERSVSNVTGKLERFLANRTRTESHLVLGKVQSGKTAHLLGVLAWAADAGLAAAVLFTGTTGSLNRQTFLRAQSDLGELSSDDVRIFNVPTVGSRGAFATFTAELREVLEARSLGRSAPFPVLVAMKNGPRANAVKQALEQLSPVIGGEGVVLAIDDEADQASQNALARKGGVAPTYKSMSALRLLPIRSLWVSYTATPQAVLLAEKFGMLRPDFVSTLAPGSGYFGIADAMREEFSRNLVIVDDWRVKASRQQERPQSLSDAVWRFLFVAWVRRSRPTLFYSRAKTPVSSQDRMRSVQMLVHESGRRQDHSRMERFVQDELDELKQVVRDGVNGTLPLSVQRSFASVFDAAIDSLALCGAPVEGLRDEFLSPEGQLEFLDVLTDCKVLVVNSDARPTAVERPVTNEDYESHACWILIGGDILGRGITIPQLIVTFFIRSSQRPNFDTVMQQLRFCGYREEYTVWTSLHAPQQTFEDLKFMEIVDRTLWERAVNWDEEGVCISGESMPRVFYAAPRHARFEPTRASIRDPNIVDRKLSGDHLAGLRMIFDPQDTFANLALIRRWKAELGSAPSRVRSHWELFEDPPKEALVRLMTSWAGDSDECSRLAALSELFDPALQELGLSHVPAAVFMSSVLDELIHNPEALPELTDKIPVSRHVSAGPSGATFDTWRKAYIAHEYLLPAQRPVLATPHVGEGQRALQRSLPYDAVVFVVEPILGIHEVRRRDSAVAIGIGLSILSPGGFEVRTIGFS